MHLLYTARWAYFHTNVFTAAKILDSEYIKDEFTEDQRNEFQSVLRSMAKTPNCKFTYPQFMAEWASLQTALATQTHGLDPDEAFSKIGCAMPSFEWASVFLCNWPGLRWVAMRLTALSCSASGFEHSWPIEGWIHSKKRNRLDQTNVERLVRMHTNLLLSGRLEAWSAAALPWEIGLLIEEPETKQRSRIFL